MLESTKIKTYQLFSKPGRRLFFLFLLLAPQISLALDPIIPECGPNGCGFSDLMKLGQNIINFIFIFAIAVSSISFAWAGFLYITARGDEGKVKKAHNIFWKVSVGLFFVFTAWIIVWIITTTLLKPDAGYIYLKEN